MGVYSALPESWCTESVVSPAAIVRERAHAWQDSVYVDHGAPVMTENLPKELFIENSKVAKQLSQGIATPSDASRVKTSATPQVIAEGENRNPPPTVRGSLNYRQVSALAFSAAILGILGAVMYVVLSKPVEPAPRTEWDPSNLSTVTATALYEHYVAVMDEGTLYEIIPNTDAGRDYFTAFFFKVNDYRMVEVGGGKLSEQQKRDMIALEERFLNLQDLELSVDVTRSDGTRFVHDGKPPASS